MERWITEYYDKMSDVYDELYGEEQWRKYVALKDVISRIKGRVVDLGCGTLLLLEFMSVIGIEKRTSMYIGVDISTGMLKKALEKAREHSSLVDLIRGDARAPCFREGSIDYIVSITALKEDELLENNLLENYKRIAREGVLISVLRENTGKLEQFVKHVESDTSMHNKAIIEYRTLMEKRETVVVVFRQKQPRHHTSRLS